MGWLDWLGPTSLSKRRGWDALPAPPPLASSVGASSEIKRGPPIDGFNAAFTVQTLVHGPGAYPWTLDNTTYGSASNSAVFACLQAIATAIAEPELSVYRVGPSERVELDATPLGALLARPNAHFSMDTLLAYVAVCLHVDGNAYWRKLRAGDAMTGNVVELWPISPTRITPTTENGSDQFIDYYRYYYTSTQYVDLAPSDVVHFRYGIDDRDHRRGLSPLVRLAREVSADDLATRYAERLLANLAINGLTLGFDKDAPPITQQTADELKARITSAYGGDNVGATAVLSPGATLTQLGFSPEQMAMDTLHRVPEERISAVLGVPAIVAGLGVGLNRATYSNFREARETFTEQKLLPLWRQLAAVITLSLVPDFTSDSSTVVDFDTSDVRALADDQNALATRLQTLVAAGIITVDEARAEIGLDAMPEAPAPTTPTEAPGASERRIVALDTRMRRSDAVRPSSERKAASDLPDRYDDLRDDVLPTWESELIAFLSSQLRRVERRLRAGADTAGDLVTDGEAVLLGETLVPLQVPLLREIERLVAAELGIQFQLDDPATRQYLQSAGGNIRGITETTRAAVQDALIAGQAEGEGIEQLARRLRELPAFDAPRGRVVARTELGTSQNHAALASYRGSGVVVGVRVLDGDYDADCQAMNGRTFPLDQAPPALQHPQCVRAFAPLTDTADVTGAA